MPVLDYSFSTSTLPCEIYAFTLTEQILWDKLFYTRFTVHPDALALSWVQRRWLDSLQEALVS